VLRQPLLAATLRRLCDEGLDSFYNGPLATDIAQDLATLGSPVSARDMAAHRATRPAPPHVQTRHGTLYNAAPPTQGIASLLILALFDRLRAEQMDGFDHIHGLVESTKQAFLWRDRHCGDPAYMESDPQDLLNDAKALDAMAARIDPAKRPAMAATQPMG
jgi:gamma-glutamyltranspeptidase/glutathione hydrolase